MKKFILKIIQQIIIYLVFLIFIIFVFDILLRNRIDNFYTKLRSPTNNGLIIGDSRALQGLNPEYFNFPIENFAFTIGHSPFDKSYLGFIKKKLLINSNTKMIHIISVTPWSILTNPSDTSDINPYFSNNLHLPFMAPNFEYLYKYVNLSFVSLIKIMNSKTETLDNGWCKIKMDSIELASEYSRRVSEKITNYRNKYPTEVLHINSERVNNLEEIIDFLSTTGSVIICRLPISNEMLQLENEKFKCFNSLMSTVAKQTNSNYIDLTDLIVQTTDGNHIFYKDACKVSAILNSRIYNMGL
jgi:hypothetical protein